MVGHLSAIPASGKCIAIANLWSPHCPAIPLPATCLQLVWTVGQSGHDIAVHADPGNWEVPSYVAKDFAEMFVNERAKVAKALNKPFILEETGKDVRPSSHNTSVTCQCLACLEAGYCSEYLGGAKIRFRCPC